MSRTDAGVIQHAGVRTGAAASLEVALETAYSELRWRTRLYVWKSGLARTRDDTATIGDDILHEALERVLKKADSYDPLRPAQAWVMKFVANVILERERSRRNDAAYLVSTPEVVKSDGDVSLSELELVQDLATERHHQLQELLALVGPMEQQVLELRYIYRLSFRELGAALGIAENAARVRHHRALARLTEAYFAAERAGSEEP